MVYRENSHQKFRRSTIGQDSGKSQTAEIGKTMVTRQLGVGGLALLSLCVTLLPTYCAASGLTFEFASGAATSSQETYPTLRMTGEIRMGDATRLVEFLRSNHEQFIAHGGTAVLAIDGGDVIDAWKIGEIVRDALIEVRLRDSGTTRCASACFFIFASAVSRVAEEGTVGIHRPHIDMAALAGASPDRVRERYATLIGETSKKLEDLLVPRDIIEKMMRTPPNDSYPLSREELDRIGETAAWFDDYSAARCAGGVGLRTRLRKAELAGYALEADALREEWAATSKCLDGVRKEHRQRLLEKWRSMREK
jgi:hypothetical protein